MAHVFAEKQLAGKTAVITGGGSGINFVIARRYAEHGAKVALIGRTKETLDNAADQIRGWGGTASGHPADVRDYDALAGAIKAARDAHGQIDLVVCGAAGNFPAPVLGMSANGFKSVIDIDLLGTFNTCRAAFEHLDRKSTRLNSSHLVISYAVFCLKKKISSDLIVSNTDAVLSGISAEVMDTLNTPVTVMTVDNRYFMIPTVIMLSVSGALITEKLF